MIANKNPSEFKVEVVAVGYLINGVSGVFIQQFAAFGNRSAKVIANVPQAGFICIVHRTRPLPVGLRDLVTRYQHVSAAPKTAEKPSCIHGSTVAGVGSFDRVRRAHHFPDFARPRLRKGMNSSHAFSQSLMIAGYLLPHFCFQQFESMECRIQARASNIGMRSRVSSSQYFFDASQKVLQNKCEDASVRRRAGHTFPPATGNSSSPSHWMKVTHLCLRCEC